MLTGAAFRPGVPTPDAILLATRLQALAERPERPLTSLPGQATTAIVGHCASVGVLRLFGQVRRSIALLHEEAGLGQMAQSHKHTRWLCPVWISGESLERNLLSDRPQHICQKDTKAVLRGPEGQAETN